MEQTFFCALDPSQREDYLQKMHSLLKEGGKLAGLLFNREFDKSGPPFGGRCEDYLPLFSQYFSVTTMEEAYNSIPQRQGTELFFIAQKQ